jgi:hypothetical protein
MTCELVRKSLQLRIAMFVLLRKNVFAPSLSWSLNWLNGLTIKHMNRYEKTGRLLRYFGSPYRIKRYNL